MVFTHRDYTVAWICALPLEMAAAKTMLDETHGSLGQDRMDHNSYTLGRVSGHNTVIVGLPSGVYGITSAATVFAHTLRTFPCLRFGLIVGIGGGVPSKDIWLGDVVVSIPKRKIGGVVQYDHGKVVRTGFLELTGSLNKPPQALLTAVSQVRSDENIGRRHVMDTISNVFQKNPGIRREYSRPNKDWLFKSDYDHLDDSADCSTCDQAQLVDRRNRETEGPCMHYGLIASGNRVMKDAKTRDLIAQQLNVLCFEMEAAGVMDQLPCLVIRGICDYCDSHKTKDWQGYAALTAAAYAKSLLVEVPSIEAEVQQAKYSECLGGLFVANPIEDRDGLRRRKGSRAMGTCDWILQTDELNGWLSQNEDTLEKKILWLYGNPGTGKSMMAIALTEELRKQVEFNIEIKKLAYFFCDSSSENHRTVNAILRGLLYQLATEYPYLGKYLDSEYKKRGENMMKSFDALWTILTNMSQDSPGAGIYCIIDALDECNPEEQQILLRQFDQTFNNPNFTHKMPCNIRFLVTSRPDDEIRYYLSMFTSRDLASYPMLSRDLKTFIRERVGSLSARNNYPALVAAEVSRVLEDRAEGTFLWVGIACDNLVPVQSRNAVKTLQTLPRQLHHLYLQLLNKVMENCDEDDRKTIIEILGAIVVAQRPLTLAELSEACQLYPDEEKNTRLQFTKEIVASCCSIVVIYGDYVRLLHQSVRDFLEEMKTINKLEAHYLLANRCLSTVINTCQSLLRTGAPESRGTFSNYSVLYWSEHAGFSENKFTIEQWHKDFFRFLSEVWDIWLEEYNQNSREIQFDVGFSVFHAGARWGIPQLFLWALNTTSENGIDSKKVGQKQVFANSQFRTRRMITPLQEAVRNGQIGMIRIILDNIAPIIEEDVFFTLVRNEKYRMKILDILLNQQGIWFQVSENGIYTVMSTFDTEVVNVLLKRRVGGIIISDRIVAAAARNHQYGEGIIDLLLDQEGTQVPITHGIIKAAATKLNQGKYILNRLLQQPGIQLQLSEDGMSSVMRHFDVETVARFLERQEGETLITGKTTAAAAGNCDWGKELMVFLINEKGIRVEITETLILEVAGNSRWAKDIMILLLNQDTIEFHLREDAILTAVRFFDSDMVTILLQRQAGASSITEKFIVVAAQNIYYPNDMLALLFAEQRDMILITEDMVIAAMTTGYFSGRKDVEGIITLFNERGYGIRITERIIRMAQATGHGHMLIKFILNTQGDHCEITAQLLELAGNTLEDGRKLIQHLLHRRGVDVMKAAAGSELCEQTIISVMLGQSNDDDLISDSALSVLCDTFATGRVASKMQVVLELYKDRDFFLTKTITAMIRRLDPRMVISVLRGSKYGIILTQDMADAVVAKGEYGIDILNLILDGNPLDIGFRSEGVTVICARFDWRILQLLQCKAFPNGFTTEMIEAAFVNRTHGKEIITAMRDEIEVTVEITKPMVAAARHTWGYGRDCLALLLEWPQSRLRITEPAILAICEWCDEEIVSMLLKLLKQTHLRLPADAVVALCERHGVELVINFLDQYPGYTRILERIVETAAHNWRHGATIIRELVRRHSCSIPVTLEALKASASNWYSGGDIIHALLATGRCKDLITEDVLMVAAANCY